MRVSSGMIYGAGLASIQKQTASLLHTQQQLSTGRRILTPSDDPVAAARALEVEQSRAINSQYLTNQKAAGETLGLAESQLASAGDLLVKVRELAVQGGNASLGDKDRKAIAGELRERFDELLGLANATDGTGQYLFSGYKGSTTPFSGNPDVIAAAAVNEIAYAGDDGQRLLQVSASRQLAVSAAGNDVFMRIRNGNGTFATAASAGNTGSGIINGGNVAGSFVADTYTISFAPSGGGLDYTVTGAASGVVATGAFVTGQAISFNGASVVITGTPAAADSFTVTPSTSRSLFKTLADLISALEAPATGSGNTALSNRIGSALTNLDQATDNLLRVRASIGARMNELDSLAGAGEDLGLQYDTQLSRLQDVDYAAAITQLTQEQTYLEAAQKSFLKVTGLSLFNYV